MLNKIIAGYVSLFTGLYLFFELHYLEAGLFFQGMALGLFGSNTYNIYKKWKKDRK
jgi:hypothetical protein